MRVTSLKAPTKEQPGRKRLSLRLLRTRTTLIGIDGQKMAVDPNNPNVVYVGTPQNGLVCYDGWWNHLAKRERCAGELGG